MLVTSKSHSPKHDRVLEQVTGGHSPKPLMKEALAIARNGRETVLIPRYVLTYAPAAC
jgi:hypothetical protein